MLREQTPGCRVLVDFSELEVLPAGFPAATLLSTATGTAAHGTDGHLQERASGPHVPAGSCHLACW